MDIRKAILLAQKENKKIALPANEHCDNGGYHIKAKPFPNNFQVLEFYGDKRKIDQFPLSPKEIVSDKWIVID